MEALSNHASQAFAVSYFGMLIVIALLECAVPRRPAADTLPLRWFGNVAINILDIIIVRAVFPVTGIAWAVVCHDRGWGLFNRTAWPPPVEIVITILALDLLLYGEHYLLHRFSFLWRCHRTHHSDRDYDLTTGLRFHPLEAAFRTALLLGTLTALGAPPVAVLVSQLLSTAITIAEHGNLRIPSWVDRVVRFVFVTPDMHRIHHSAAPAESRSNLSTTFSWWDRLFGTYVEQPSAGHTNIMFGVPGLEERKHLTLPWMLAQPFIPHPDPVAGKPSSSVALPEQSSHRV